jgi:hypothetical protein
VKLFILFAICSTSASVSMGYTPTLGTMRQELYQ